MEISELTSRIKAPNKKHDYLVEINALANKYPYSSTLQLLHVLNEYQNGKFGFDEVLDARIQKVSCRKTLERYIDQQNGNSLEELENTDFTAHNNKEDIVSDRTEQAEKTASTTSETNSNQNKRNTEIDPLEIDVINAAIQSSLEKEILTTSVQQEQKDINSNSKKEEDVPTIDLDNPTQNHTESSKSYTKQETESTSDEPKSFLEWLKAQQSTSSSSEDLLELTDEQENKEHLKEKQAKTELLNKFIEEEPSMPKPKKEFYSPVKKAKESLTENQELVSETLAKIYVLQKNYSKAIEAYEQLSLLYPEKKTFFADQIVRIKEKQNL